MAQGQKLKKKTTIVSRKSTGPKRGKVISTKNSKIAKVQNMQKKLSANMTRSLEQTMAAKASSVGKLTIMKGAGIEGKEKDKGKKPRKF